MGKKNSGSGALDLNFGLENGLHQACDLNRN